MSMQYAPAIHDMTSTRQTPLRHWAVIFGAWTLFGIAQTILQLSIPPEPGMYRPEVWRMLAQFMPRLWLWAALTPLIAGYDRRIEERLKFLPARFGFHFPLYVICAIAESWVRRSTIGLLGARPVVPFYVTVLYFADIEAVRYVAALMLGRALAAARQLTERERRESALKEEVARAQLHYLDLQLQPHFLFNALGSISELAHEAPEAAARMVEHLSSLLRYATERSTGQEVTLREELDALSPYLEIQRMRFPDWLSITESIEPSAADAVVPRLLLQPLVENAIRHGLSHRRSGGLIAFHARADGDDLVLSVHDNGAGLTNGPAMPGLGIGLTNIRERLETLYGAAQSLELVSHTEGGVEVVVRIPFRHSATLQSRNALLEQPSIDDAEPSSIQAPKPELATGTRSEILQLSRSWVAAGVVLTSMSLAYVLIRHPTDHEPVLEVVRRHAIHSTLWILLTPVVLLLARRFPLSRDKLVVSIPAHLIFACLVGMTHVGAAGALVGGMESWFFYSGFLDSLFWNMAAYAILLAFFERRQMEIFIRERDATAARMRGELTIARLSSVMLELRPDFLLSALATLRSLVIVDASRAELLLSRFAEFLRLTLDSLGDQNVPLERELKALSAYGRLHRAAAGHFPEIVVDCSPELEKCLVPTGLLRTLADRLLEAAGLTDRVDVTVRRNDGVLTMRFVPGNDDNTQPAVFSSRRDPSERLARLTDSGATISYMEDTSSLEVALPMNGDSSHAKVPTLEFRYT